MTDAIALKFEQVRDVFNAIERLVPRDRAIAGLSAIGIDLCNSALMGGTAPFAGGRVENASRPPSVRGDYVWKNLDTAIRRVSHLNSMLFVIQGDGSDPYARLDVEHRDNYVWLASEISTEVLSLLKSVNEGLLQ